MMRRDQIGWLGWVNDPLLLIAKDVKEVKVNYYEIISADIIIWSLTNSSTKIRNLRIFVWRLSLGAFYWKCFVFLATRLYDFVGLRYF